MTLRIATMAAVLLLAVSCSDDPERPHAPTAPAPAPSASIATPPASTGKSTICRSFTAERDVRKGQLEQRKNDAALQKEVRSLERLVADVCD